MLPNPAINFNAPITAFLPPENQVRCDMLTDYEMGSLLIRDPTGGLQQAIWKGWLEDQTFKVQLASGGPITDVLTVTGEVTELSLAFDSNMRPHFAYMEDDQAKLFWYNTQTSQNEILSGLDHYSPRLCLDDKRDRQSANRDILLFYLRAESSSYDRGLYCRQQRDRFEIEYFLIDTPAVMIGQVGMAVGNRVQIELITSDVCGPAGNFLVFTPVTDAYKVTLYESNIVTADICIMPKSVVSIVDGEYQINSNGWTATAGLMSPTDTVQVRRQSSDQYETTVTCTLTVGWYSGIFSITTGPQGGCLPEAYVRPNFDAAHASWQDADLYTRPDFDAADAQFLPLCE